MRPDGGRRHAWWPVAFILWIHHMNFDILSMGCFLREFHVLMTAEDPLDAQLPKLSLQYADFAAWQRACVLAGNIATMPLLDALRAVKEATGSFQLDLPTDKPRPRHWTFSWNRTVVALPFLLQVREAGITPFSAYLAALVIQMAKASFQQNIIVGVPYHGRDDAGLEPLCGYFINMLPVIGACSSKDTTLTVLQQTRGAWLSAMKSAAVPFLHVVDKLTQEQGTPFDPSRNPIFQTMLNYLAEALSHRGDDRMMMQQVHQLEGHIDMDVQIDRTSRGGVTIMHSYCAELFNASTVEAYSMFYVSIVRA